VERYPAVSQRRQPVRISLYKQNMVALFGEHDGCRETNVPCSDYGCAQIVLLHAPMLADASRPPQAGPARPDVGSPRPLFRWLQSAR
jgi:hypothetical protein